MKKTKVWITFSTLKETKFLGYLINIKGQYYFQSVIKVPPIKIENGDQIEWISHNVPE